MKLKNLCIGALLLTSSLFAGQVNIVYEKPSTKNERIIKQELIESKIAEDVVSILNEDINFKKDINIVFGSSDGPLFDPQTNEILIPYTFLDEIKNRFKAVQYDKNGISVNQAVNDSLAHTILHEMGHALITLYNLPVVGKEEDAVDSLATVLLIEYFEEGGEMAISTADLFSLESRDIKEFKKEDFWGEHSLDIQRYYSTMCLVYGSNPKEYKSISDDLGYTQDKEIACEDEYINIKNSWLEILKPYLKK